MVIACGGCNTILEMDLTMKPRDHEAAIGVGLDGSVVRWCSGSMGEGASRGWRDLIGHDV
jgi:hypothetical protein